MAARRILITGADGFVGRHLVAAIQAAHPDTTLLTSRFDVTDAAAADRAVGDAAPHACVHLAAVAAIGEARADPARAWTVNLHGTLNLARAVLRHAPRCVLLFPSSADIYGGAFRAGHALNESAVPAPLNTYGATKAAADLALGAMAAAEGLRVIRARPFNHTGPGQADSFVVPAFARQIALIEAGRQPPVLRVGALAPQRDFLDVGDVCDAYVALLDAAESVPNGAILNVASGTPRRVGDVLDRLLALSGVAATVETDADRLRPSDIPVAIGEAGALRRLTGWAPRRDWDGTLRAVLEDWRVRVRQG